MTILLNEFQVKKNINFLKGLTKSGIEKWHREVVAINCLCDPVKRLFSDFLHVRANYTKLPDKPCRYLFSQLNEI